VRTISAAIGFGIVCWLGIAVSAASVRADAVAQPALRAEALAKAAQAAPAQAPQMSDTVFKNIQVLKGFRRSIHGRDGDVFRLPWL
jgi:hypothetical protein